MQDERGELVVIDELAQECTNERVHHCEQDGNCYHTRLASAWSSEAIERKLSGHVVVYWEGDLIFGSKNSQIATLVERQTRYVMLVRTDGKDTETVINALIKQAHQLPKELYKSLTWDRGSEMESTAQAVLPKGNRSIGTLTG